MVSYTRLNVCVLSLITTCIIYFGIYLLVMSIYNLIIDNKSVHYEQIINSNNEDKKLNSVNSNNTAINNFSSNNSKKNTTTNKVITTNKTTNSVSENKVNTNKTSNSKQKMENLREWKIVIPTINLEAPIAEGTSKEIMNSYVGHFENTSTLEGNIGLAAHNRGYPVNYFQNIKKLKEGDIIEYFFGNNKKTYKVQIVTVISDTNWSYLLQTTDNRITLITCVEDKPEYRRCIQAIEI